MPPVVVVEGVVERAGNPRKSIEALTRALEFFQRLKGAPVSIFKEV